MRIAVFAVALSLLLPIRRAAEFVAIAATLRRLRARRQAIAAASYTEAEFPHLVVMLPVYREQLVIAQLICHFERMAYPADKLLIVLITTEKEPSDDALLPSTRAMVERILAAKPYPAFLHLHYPRAHRFRAEQLNFAISQLLPSLTPSETYIGVYNADSTPSLDSFTLLARDACAQRASMGCYPPAYQQGAEYRVPMRATKVTAAALTIAALQNVYTFAHYLPRLLRSEAASPRRRQHIPVTFLGHGEFVRLDALQSIHLFPNYAYADGLLLGWEVAFAGYPIRVLPVCDYCEVPGDLRTVLRQHTAWFVGLLNLGEVSGSPRIFFWRRMLSTLAWGLRTPYLLALSLTAALGGWKLFVISAICIAIYALTPLFFFRSAGSTRSAKCLAASIPALLADGLGFWPALQMKLRVAPNEAMPPKTDR